MNISVLGAGKVGGTLGRRWAELGHEVVFGVRDPGKEEVRTLLARAGPNAQAKALGRSTQDADVIVLAVPWEAARQTLVTAGKLEGKVLIDATNPIVMSLEGLEQGLVIGHTSSAAEQIADWSKDAHVVKAFCTVGWESMDNSRFGEYGLTLPLCGDDAEAKGVVFQLAEELGFDPVDVGPLKSARYLEPLAMLWIDMAVLRGFGRQFGFQLVRR